MCFGERVSPQKCWPCGRSFVCGEQAMPKKKMPRKKSLRSVQGTIRYLLSDKGRHECLLHGGDGKREQVQTGPVDEASIGWFTLEEDGSLSYDLTSLLLFDMSDVSSIPKGLVARTGPSDCEIYWEVVPTWKNLLVPIQQLEREKVRRNKERKDAARVFLDAPDLRADEYRDEEVSVSEHWFGHSTKVFAEAQRRRKSDRKALEQRSQHTMARWIEQHGDTNQKERLAAGLLPWEEASEAIDLYYFRQLYSLIRGVGEGHDLKLQFYGRFVIEDICKCSPSLEDAIEVEVNGYKPVRRLCKPQFLTAEATALSEGEWNNLSYIKKVLAETWPGETYNVGLREHRAKCRSAKVPLVRRTALVTVSLDELSFQREFLLTEEVADDAISS